VVLVDHVEGLEHLDDRHPLGGLAGVLRAERLDRVLREGDECAALDRLGVLARGGAGGDRLRREHGDQAGRGGGLEHRTAILMDAHQTLDRVKTLGFRESGHCWRLLAYSATMTCYGC